MEIKDLLQQAFLTEWNRLSSRSVSHWITEINDSFAIDNVRNKINESINESFDKDYRERYHRQNLNELARLYAHTLYSVSNNGLNVNASTIKEAKAQMKGKGNCDAYPC